MAIRGRKSVPFPRHKLNFIAFSEMLPMPLTPAMFGCTEGATKLEMWPAAEFKAWLRKMVKQENAKPLSPLSGYLAVLTGYAKAMDPRIYVCMTM